MISLIYTKGGNVNTADQDGKTSLHHAVKFHSHQALDYLCQKTNVDINAKSNKGRTSLMLAVKSSCYSCVERILKSNADLNAIDLWGEHVLSYLQDDATSNRIMGLLVTNSAKQNALSLVGQRRLLQTAVNMGASVFVQVLLEARVDPNYVDAFGQSPLRSAVANGYEDIVEILMTNGADPTLKGSCSGFTPIHVAIFTRNITILQLLVSNKPPIDVQDDQGQTVLHIALHENCPPAFIDVLLSAGASEACTNNLGLTPLEVAIKTSHESLGEKELHDLKYAITGYGTILETQYVIGDGEDVVGLVGRDSAENAECAALKPGQLASSTYVAVAFELFANSLRRTCQYRINVITRARRIYHGDGAFVVLTGGMK
jgi:ankyrin repeat protein